MMTCRLLCALLVLALCCCPSVYAGDAQPEAAASSQTTTTTTTQPPVPKEKSEPKPNVAAVPPPSTPDPSQGTGQPGSSTLGPVPDQGNVGGSGPGVTAGGPQSNVVTNNLQAEGRDGMTGRQNGTNTSADKAAQEAKDPAETTTTTTTKAPTTTTTTTTAPEAPSTTTTEAPDVSTTRAPSRLREIDGSLSSSAWVCAPLVLAASALAYTALS
ncbi:putative mucin TcMUCII [Trypanosoma cruzi]|nr:putative mucin TcMUCII [Trypanosoma cruzi]